MIRKRSTGAWQTCGAYSQTTGFIPASKLAADGWHLADSLQVKSERYSNVFCNRREKNNNGKNEIKENIGEKKLVEKAYFLPYLKVANTEVFAS